MEHACAKNAAFESVCLQLKEKTDKIEQAFEDKLMQKDKQIAALVM